MLLDYRLEKTFLEIASYGQVRDERNCGAMEPTALNEYGFLGVPWDPERFTFIIQKLRMDTRPRVFQRAVMRTTMLKWG